MRIKTAIERLMKMYEEKGNVDLSRSSLEKIFKVKFIADMSGGEVEKGLNSYALTLKHNIIGDLLRQDKTIFEINYRRDCLNLDYHHYIGYVTIILEDESIYYYQFREENDSLIIGKSILAFKHDLEKEKRQMQDVNDEDDEDNPDYRYDYRTRD